MPRCHGCSEELESPSGACKRCGLRASESFWQGLAVGPAGAPASWTSPTLEDLLLEGRYRVGALIAKGGMGVVHRGEDVLGRQAVAIKFLSDRYLGETDVVARFRREAETTSRLSHPSIVPVYAVGDVSGRPYFVMELIEGRTVAELIRERGRLVLCDAVAIADQVCAGLAHIHDHGLVHRDIKSQNILVEPAGRARLLDFGILRVQGATRTRTAFLAGTPEYMSPEQALDPTAVDGRADLYSLGVTFFEMVTGRLPYRSASPFKVLLQHQSQPIPRATVLAPDLPPIADALFQKALAKDAASRFARAADLRDAMHELLRPNAGPRRRSLGRSAAVVLSVALLAGAAFAWFRPGGARSSAAATSPVAVGAVVQVAPLRETRSSSPVPLAEGGAERTPADGVSVRPSRQSRDATVGEALSSVAPALAAESVGLPLSPRSMRRPKGAGKTLQRARRSKGARARPAVVDAEEDSEQPLPAAVSAAPSAAPPPEPPSETTVAVAERPPPELARGSTVPTPASDAAALLHVVTLHENRGTWARIYVDGDFVNESHAAYRRVPPGPHEVTARREGFREVSRELRLHPGEARKLVLILERAP